MQTSHLPYHSYFILFGYYRRLTDIHLLPGDGARDEFLLQWLPAVDLDRLRCSPVSVPFSTMIPPPLPSLLPVGNNHACSFRHLWDGVTCNAYRRTPRWLALPFLQTGSLGRLYTFRWGGWDYSSSMYSTSIHWYVFPLPFCWFTVLLLFHCVHPFPSIKAWEKVTGNFPCIPVFLHAEPIILVLYYLVCDDCGGRPVCNLFKFPVGNSHIFSFPNIDPTCPASWHVGGYQAGMACSCDQTAL